MVLLWLIQKESKNYIKKLLTFLIGKESSKKTHVDAVWIVSKQSSLYGKSLVYTDTTYNFFHKLLTTVKKVNQASKKILGIFHLQQTLWKRIVLIN